MNGAKWVSPLRGALVAALCALFFLLAMGVTLMGSSVYRNTVASATENYGQRTAHRTEGVVQLGRFDGADALILSEGEYMTVLYVYDGALRTLYTQPGSGLTAADGEAVLPAEGLTFALEDDLLTLTVTLEGTSYSTSLMPRCGVEEVGEVMA